MMVMKEKSTNEKKRKRIEIPKKERDETHQVYKEYISMRSRDQADCCEWNTCTVSHLSEKFIVTKIS